MFSRAQHLLEDSENYLYQTTNNLRSSKLWKILAAVTFFSIVFILLGFIVGLFSVEEHGHKKEVLQQPAPLQAPPAYKIEDLEKNSFIKPLLDYYENRFKRSFLQKKEIPLAKKVFKYGKNIDKILPILKETSHENKYITKSVLKKLRQKRNLVESIELDPLQVDYKFLKSKIRDKRAEIELNKLEKAYIRCKKEASTVDCQPLFMEMLELAKEIHKNTAIMTKLLNETKQIIKTELSSKEGGSHNSPEVPKIAKQLIEKSEPNNRDEKNKTIDNQFETSTKIYPTAKLDNYNTNQSIESKPDATTKTFNFSTEYNITEINKTEVTTKPTSTNYTREDSTTIKSTVSDVTSPKYLKNLELPDNLSNNNHSISTEYNITEINKTEVTTKPTSTNYTREDSTTIKSTVSDVTSPKYLKNLELSDNLSNNNQSISTEYKITEINKTEVTTKPTSTNYTREDSTTIKSTVSDVTSPKYLKNLELSDNLSNNNHADNNKHENSTKIEITTKHEQLSDKTNYSPTEHTVGTTFQISTESEPKLKILDHNIHKHENFKEIKTTTNPGNSSEKINFSSTEHTSKTKSSNTTQSDIPKHKSTHEITTQHTEYMEHTTSTTTTITANNVSAKSIPITDFTTIKLSHENEDTTISSTISTNHSTESTDKIEINIVNNTNTTTKSLIDDIKYNSTLTPTESSYVTNNHDKIQTPNITDILQINTTSNPIKTFPFSDAILAEDHSAENQLDQTTKIAIILETITKSIAESEKKIPEISKNNAEELTSNSSSIIQPQVYELSPRNVEEVYNFEKTQANSEENKIESSEKIYKALFSEPVNVYPIATKVHEDMHKNHHSYQTFKLGDHNDFDLTGENWFKQNINAAIDHQPFENINSDEAFRQANIGHAAEIPHHIPASGPFISLCEEFNKQNEKTKTTPVPQNGGFTNPASTHFTSRGLGGFPVTGESMKASAQFVYNPNFGVPSVPICFYANPYNMQMFNNKQNMGGYWSPFAGPSGLNQHSGFGAGTFPFYPNSGNMQQTVSPGPYGHTSTASANHNFNSNNKNLLQQSPPFFCTYMPNSQYGQLHNNFNVRMRDANENITEFIKYPNIPSPSDIIYASYANQMAALVRHDTDNHCKDADSISCFATHQCIAKSKWCDSIVDCMDASDESACSCKARLPETRICDGYSDCPLGEDETGCFGCDKSMFTCYNNQDEYMRAGNSTIGMCYSSINKCDGFKNCLNGNDEKECNIIVGQLGNHVTHSKSYTEGYLHRNHKGKWYPACGNTEKWARDACEAETGQIGEEPTIKLMNGIIPGPFIHPSDNTHGQDFIESCKHNSENVVIHVKCPELKCGRVVERPKQVSFRKRRSTYNSTELARDRLKRDDERVVGGKLCSPTEWPFIVALYRNGKYHCGGIIYDDNWIITAAHCVINARSYYFEIHAGMLRRSSYSASVQIIKVSNIVTHHKYDRLNMKNDFALLQIENRLKFNRFTKPVCMPDQKRTVGLFGDNWISGPKEGTICTAVGWGAIREKGLSSDHLRQVQVPIMKNCKRKQDKEAYDICAGEPNGGRDACQGDSGGPLFCKSVSDSKEWYLAGVISHGEGCARPGEPGVYTRVAMYIDWIKSVKTEENLQSVKPLKSCPGYVCIWGATKCIEKKKRCDRIVDCLGGEDEVGCEYNTIPDVGSAVNVTSAEDEDLTESTAPLNIEANEDATEKIDTEITHIDIESFKATLSDKGMLKKFEKLQIAPVVENNELNTLTTQIHEKIEVNSTTPDKFSLKGKDLFESTTEHNINSTTPTTTTIEIQNSTSEGIFSNAGKFIKNLFSDPNNSTNIVDSTTESLTHSTDIHDKNIKNDKNEFSNISGGDLPPHNLDDETFKKTHGEIKKRENATDIKSDKNKGKNLNVHKNLNKFMCTRIPQSIDISNKCDRILDCEDGTDEEDCTCRDYLKGTLNILVCDGKTDCEDLTDELNCDNCSSTEFHCPLSKRCIQSLKRCDNTIDCSFKEDELDCFALTNGEKVFLDANKRPYVKDSGIFARNRNGIWHVVCSEETNIHKNASGVDEVCSILGFKGHKFYNTTNIYNKGGEIESIIDEITTKERVASEKYERFEKITRSNKDSNENCDALYVECQPSSNVQHPIIKTDIQSAGKTLFKEHEKLNPIIKPEHKPNVVVKPNIASLVEIHQSSDWQHENILKPISHSVTDTKLEKVTEDTHHYSWSVDVYVNGELICNGVLLDKYWVAVHGKCVHDISLINDYIAVLLGGGKTNYNSKGADEQIRHVDCIKFVKDSNINLLHLHHPIKFTRYVLPTFLPDRTTDLKSKQHKCMSVAHDKFDRIKTFDVKETLDKSICGSMIDDGHEAYHNHSNKLCFENGLETNKELKRLMCDDKITSKNDKYGLIVCQDDNSGWYPKSFYNYNMTTCNLNKIIISDDLAKCNENIEKIIDLNQCDYPFVQVPFCPTLMRCPLGKCLPSEKICDGNIDCYDGSDENSKLCNIHKQACGPSEFKCKNGICVSKTKFCDHINDCGDLSDEPTICSCYTYLNATDPSKICDGIRNCWDKSDENPAYCKCTNDKYRCGKSNECIPRDFLCDKQPDCPNGEDEQYCLGVELPSVPYTSSDGYGQIIEQSYGVWHTKCFPRQDPLNSTDITKICNKLGYKIINNPKYRLIENETEENSNEDNDEVNEYRTLKGSKDIITKNQQNKNQTILDEQNKNSSASTKYLASTKAMIVNQFSPLRLNDKLMIYMKPSRPIAELVKWNALDSAKCYRLEIKCD